MVPKVQESKNVEYIKIELQTCCQLKKNIFIINNLRKKTIEWGWLGFYTTSLLNYKSHDFKLTTKLKFFAKTPWAYIQSK